MKISFMKTLRSALFIATLFTTLISCKKDSDPTPSSTEVTGSWSIKTLSADPEESLVGGMVTSLLEDECTTQYVFTFKDGGNIEVSSPATCTGSDVEGLISNDTKWEVKNGKLILTDSEESTESSFKISNNEMTLTTEVDDLVGKVKLTMVMKRK